MISRTGFFRKLNAEFSNMRWSWCAVHHGRKEVYFGIWDTQSTGATGIILSEAWGEMRGRRQPGYSDALKKIKLIQTEGYSLKVFKMIQGQTDFIKRPSIIREIQEELIPSKLEKTNAGWIAVFDSPEDEVVEAIPPAEVSSYPEGAKCIVVINAVERNRAARKVCIDHYGSVCKACRFDFEKKYGNLGSGFIHVHHINPVAAAEGPYEVDPIRDLRPLCPNCHAMVHRVTPPMSVEELAKILIRTAAQ